MLQRMQMTAVAYLKLYDGRKSTTRFLMGIANLDPMHGHTIPRLELCAAVLATEIAEIIRDQLKIPQDNFLFFTDCQVVLGYISNETKRFYIYVANRVGRIRFFFRTEYNPADAAFHSIDASQLEDSAWLRGQGESFKYQPNLNSIFLIQNRIINLGLK